MTSDPYSHRLVISSLVPASRQRASSYKNPRQWRGGCWSDNSREGSRVGLPRPRKTHPQRLWCYATAGATRLLVLRDCWRYATVGATRPLSLAPTQERIRFDSLTTSHPASQCVCSHGIAP